MKILKIIHTMGHGGAENIFRWLSFGLKKEGADVVAGIPMDNDPNHSENWIGPALKELDIPRVYFDKRGNALAMLKSIKRMIGQAEPDIVHSHLLDANFYSGLACRLLSIPHVSTEHGDIRISKRMSARIKFGLLPFLSTSVVCVSESLRKTAAHKCLGSGKILTIYNGIYSPDRGSSTFREEWDIPENAIVVGNVGNLYAVKGQRFLIDAFARFLSVEPGTYLVLVGRGREENRLRQQAARLAIPENRIIFTGFRKDIANILGALNIYVQPSLSEGLPVAILEAMSANLPVVATAVGGVSEIIKSPEYGTLVPPGSANSIFQALTEIIAARQDFIARAYIAGTWVREQFSLNKMTKKYLGLYHKILQTG